MVKMLNLCYILIVANFIRICMDIKSADAMYGVINGSVDFSANVATPIDDSSASDDSVSTASSSDGYDELA